jgi:hypothetical protein
MSSFTPQRYGIAAPFVASGVAPFTPVALIELLVIHVVVVHVIDVRVNLPTQCGKVRV